MAEEVKKRERYKPRYAEEAKQGNKSLRKSGSKKLVIESIKARIGVLQKNIKALKEDDDFDPNEKADVLDDAVDEIEDIIGDVIDVAGATDPTVQELIQAADTLEMHQDIAEDQAEGEETVMAEAEEDDKKDSEEDDEKDEKEDDKKEESFKPSVKRTK